MKLTYEMLQHKKIFIYLFSFLIVLAIPFLGRSQTPEPKLVITWRAESYVPAFYEGKVLPTSGSKIEASVELFEGNTIANLGAQTIYWYMNGEFLAGGEGVKRVELRAPDSGSSGTFDLRAQLPDYGGDVILRTIEVPVVRPEAVIDAPFPSGFSQTPIRVMGHPFFFNVSKPGNLRFAWTVNGQVPANAENPAILNIDVDGEAPSGYELSLALDISNPLKFLEAASANPTRVYKR